ncbi:flagellar hook-associated protein 1 [mine drainage metagenome]|uniref:Flagellar hook-associated protein 1 n=1 Tax=mine drainage metagenome TaxID=410659 RepID=A0A1J5SSI6_9ZZZZ
MSIYGIAVSALNAAQAGLTTTSNNIANANTPGYSRQQIVQAAMLPQNTGSGYLGQGVNVTTVVRRYDQFLGAQVLEAQTQSSNLNTQLGLAQQVSNLLGGTNGGLTPSMQDFFTAVNAVANAPQSVPARQTMIGSAQSLVNGFQTMNQSLNQIRDGLNGQITTSVAQINSYATQIASLNDKIVQMQANNPNQPPNDLLDQRDQLINQLSQQIRVSTIKQGNGSMDVFIGNGQSLVLGNQTTTLQAVPSTTDPTALEVAYTNNGTVNRIQQSSLQGGSLGGYISFRQTILDPAINALGRIAMGFASTFNQQQQQGIDLNGALGTNMFTMAAPRVTAATTNAGNGVIAATVSSTSALTGNDYSVQFDGTNYNVYNTSNNSLVQSFTPAQMAAGQTVTGTGITLQLTGGAATAGDSFLVRPTVDGAGSFALNITDPTKIAAASPIRSNAPTSNLGTGTIAAATVSGGVPLNANLQQPVTITFNNPPTTFNVTGTGTGNPTNVPYTAGAAITYNGWTTQISGAPAAGDTFTVSQNTNATTDGSNSLLMAALQTTNTLANNTTSYQGAYGQLIGQIGTQTNQLTVTSQAQTTLLNSVTASQQAVSGVNLDEEAANLVRYQQAYQAAGKAMQVANTMFDTILNLK